MNSVNPNNDGGVSASIHGANLTSTPADGGQGNAFLEYFGPPNGAVNAAPYDKYKYTTYDLPEAYIGKNLYLRDTIDGLITGDNAQHTWYTSPACLPYQETDQIHLSWNVWQFNRTLAGQVPHEGISRLITSSKRQFKDHTVRHGLAFYLEHGFMGTAEGRQQYQRNLMGIKQCVQETNNHDVLATLLHSPRYDREYQIKHGEYNRPMGEILRREVSEWAVVQKSGHGLDWLIEEYKEHLSHAGVTPTVFIIPPKMAMFMTMSDPVKTQYMYAGADGNNMLKEGPSALTTYRGVNVFKTHSFDVYEGELPIDLLRRDMQIGEFYVMKDTVSNHSDSYKGHMRDILIYDETKDDWQRISFQKALEKCERFDDDGFLRPPGGHSDMFTVENYDGSPKNVTLWGQMDPTYLNSRVLDGVSDTSALSQTPEQQRAFDAGIALMRTWDTLQVAPEIIAARTFTSETVDIQVTGITNSKGKVWDGNTKGSYAGCGNYVCMKSISGGSENVAQTCLAFLNEVTRLYDEFIKMFPNSKLLNSQTGGSAFLTAYFDNEKEKSVATFFENCIGAHRLPLWTGTSNTNQTSIVDPDKKTITSFEKAFKDWKVRYTNMMQMYSNASTKTVKEQIEMMSKEGMDSANSVGDTTQCYITPFSYTVGMTSLPTNWYAPDERAGGYNYHTNSAPGYASMRDMHPIGAFALPSMAVMQRQHLFKPKLSALKRPIEAEAGSWGGTAKRYRANAGIDDLMGDLLGNQSTSSSASQSLPSFSDIGPSMAVAATDRTGNEVWHNVMHGGNMLANMSHAKSIHSTIGRMGALIFLFSTPTRHSILANHKHNVRLPFSILLAPVDDVSDEFRNFDEGWL